MSPPPVAGSTIGGTTTGRLALTAKQLDTMTRAAHVALDGCGVAIGPSKVSKLIRRFGSALSKHGMTFHEFLSDEANLTPQQQRRLLGNPDWQHVIAYSDPTGETAVNRAMRGGPR